MNVYAALDTIIQQNVKILELFESAIADGEATDESLKNEIDKNLESINTINDKLDAFWNNSSNEIAANNLNKIKSALGSNKSGAAHTVTKVVEDLQKLGTNYSSLYSLAHTVKNFIEATDTADKTINTWKEIENFLSSIKDTDTLQGLLDSLNTKIINDVRNEFLVKDADRETIRLNEDGIIKVKYDATTYKFGDMVEKTDTPIECSMQYQTSSEDGGGIYAKVLAHYYDGSRELNENNTNVVQEKGLAKHITEINNTTNNIINSIPNIVEDAVATDKELEDVLGSL